MEYVFIILLRICTVEGCTEPFTDYVLYKSKEVCLNEAFTKSILISEELVNNKSFDGIAYRIEYTCDKIVSTNS
jgi:hypothetical protein